MLEHELKFTPGPFFRVPDLARSDPGVRADAPDTVRLQAVYYDTDDFRLARAGASLRYRNVEGWTVKLPGRARRGALARHELHVDGEPGDDPPEAALDLVHALARRAPLATRRPAQHRAHSASCCATSEGTKLGEVVDDEVSVLDGARLAARFRELEVEFAEDAPDTLERRARRPGSAPPAPASPTRCRRSCARSGRAPPTHPTSPPPPPLDFASTPPEVRAGRDRRARPLRLLVNDPGVRLGTDPEAVHQARVATRRLRSDLRTFRRGARRRRGASRSAPS